MVFLEQNFERFVEAVVGFAGRELELAHRDSKPGHDVHVGHVLYDPTALSKLAVDFLTGYGFGCRQRAVRKLKRSQA